MLARALHIALALLLLATSAGATLSVHFCGGRAVEWALNKLADDCGMPRHAPAQHEPSDAPQLERAPCCSDELSYHKLDVEQADDSKADGQQPDSDVKPALSTASAKTGPAPAAALTAGPIIRPPPEPAPQRTRRAALGTYLL